MVANLRTLRNTPMQFLEGSYLLSIFFASPFYHDPMLGWFHEGSKFRRVILSVSLSRHITFAIRFALPLPVGAVHRTIFRLSSQIAVVTNHVIRYFFFGSQFIIYLLFRSACLLHMTLGFPYTEIFPEILLFLTQILRFKIRSPSSCTTFLLSGRC